MSTPRPSPIPETVLVVDDDDQLRELYRRIIEMRGFHAVTAENGKKAIELAEKLSPDLVLLDLMLPDMSGFEVCDKIRRLRRGPLIPILVISGKSDRDMLFQVLSRGADDFLRKPVSSDELLARVESQLRAKSSRDRYARTFAAYPAPLAVTGIDGKILEANEAMETLLGASRGEILRTELTEWISEENREGAQRLLLKCRDEGQAAEMLVRPAKAAPDSQNARTLQAIRLDSATSEVLVSLSDASEKIRMREELAQTKEFLESLIAHSMLAIVAADTRGRILVFNDAAERLSGYKRNEVVGRMSIADFYAPGVARDVMRRLRSELYGGEGKLEPCVNAIVSKSGEEIPVMLSASILYDRDGNEVATMGYFEDIRERIQIEQAVAEARVQTEARERKAAVAALAGAAAHELNQPLTAIMGSAQLLEQQKSADETAARYVSRILSESERMAKILKDLGKADLSSMRHYAGDTEILDLGEAADAEGAETHALADLLDRVGRFSETLSASVSAESLVGAFSDIIGKIFPEQSLFLGIFSGKALEVVTASGEVAKLQGKSFSSARIRRHLTRKSRQNRVVTDFTEILPFAPQSPSTQAVLIVPLWAMQHEVGIVWIELKNPNQATPERTALVRLLGNQFAVTYRNLILFERTGYLEGYVEGLIRHTNAAILVLDSLRRVKMANRVMEELLGVSEGALLGADFFDYVVVDERYERWKSSFEQALAGKPVVSEPIDILGEKGVIRNLVINATLIPAVRPGESGDVLFVGLDVTEAKGLREEILQREKLASLGEMAASIAHEFNSPLTVLNSAAELLARGTERLGAAGEELRKPVTFLRESMDRVQGLARNLLSFARPSNREAKARIKLDAEVAKALSFVRYEIGRSGVKVETKLSQDLPEIEGVASEIQQALLNLINNASQAMMPKGGLITIAGLRGGDGWAEISVTDQGRGIPSELEARIFEPFVTSKREGSGLGLYIVRGIVERHGGTIGVESTKNGTTFRLRFPPVK